MSRNKSYQDAVAECVQDREMVSKPAGYPWSRRCCLDLFTKLLILHVNLIGLRSRCPRIVYVDEIKNSNMANNLHKTARIVSGDDARFLSFYHVDRAMHVRAGILWTVCSFVVSLLSIIPAVVMFIGSKEPVNRRMMLALIRRFDKIVSRLEGAELFVLMTDHHFYSSALAMVPPVRTVVLQHGLIQDRRFFTPVRADRFFAWSQRSVEIDDDERAIATGTYKFDVTPVDESRVDRVLEDARNVLVLLSSSKTTDEIRKRLRPVLELQRTFGFTVLVKLHPGSLFSMKSLIDSVDDASIRLYQEESLDSLVFDFAFVEQSTASLDIACMGIPQIIIDDLEESYFSGYAGKLPIAHDDRELIALAHAYRYEDYRDSYRDLLECEIQSGRCDIKGALDAMLNG